MFKVLDVLAVFVLPGATLLLTELEEFFSLDHEAVPKEDAHHHVEVGWDDVYDAKALDIGLARVFFNHGVDYIQPPLEGDPCFNARFSRWVRIENIR